MACFQQADKALAVDEKAARDWLGVRLRAAAVRDSWTRRERRIRLGGLAAIWRHWEPPAVRSYAAQIREPGE